MKFSRRKAIIMIEAELNELESRQMKEILKTTSTEKLVFENSG